MKTLFLTMVCFSMYSFGALSYRIVESNTDDFCEALNATMPLTIDGKVYSAKVPGSFRVRGFRNQFSKTTFDSLKALKEYVNDENCKEFFPQKWTQYFASNNGISADLGESSTTPCKPPSHIAVTYEVTGSQERDYFSSILLNNCRK